MKNAFSDSYYRDGLGMMLPFRPIFEALTPEDYSMIAKRLQRYVQWHTVLSDGTPSSAFEKELCKFIDKDAEFALACALYTDTGINIRKAIIRLEADMDRGKIKKSPVFSVAIFQARKMRIDNHMFFFRFNDNVAEKY